MNTTELLMKEFEEFAADHKQSLSEIRKEIDEIAKKSQRIHATPRATSEPELKAFDLYMRKGVVDPEFLEKSMSVGTDADGGFAVPQELDRQINEVAVTVSPIRNLATVVPASSGAYERIVSLHGATAEWLGETDTRNDTDSPTLAKVTPPHGELSACPAVTTWLLNDAMFNIEEFIAREVGLAIGVYEGAAFVSTGDGTKKPKAILQHTLAETGDATRTFGQLEKMTTAAAGTFSADELITFVHKLAPRYRANAAWLMSTEMLAAVRQIKDANDRPLLSESLASGTPATLLGYPVYEDPNVPVPAAGANAAIFGDFRSGYIITDIGRRLVVRDPYTVKGYVKFWMPRRVGGCVLDSNALKVLALKA